MKVVVTGASGNLGTSVLGCLGNDESVTSIVGVARRKPAIDLPKVEWKQADVGTSTLEPLFDGADALVHLAWQIQPSHDQWRLERTNVTGSRRVFHAAIAAGITTIVYASSIGAYGAGPKAPRVSEDWRVAEIPSSSYSRHKVAVEQMLDALESDHREIRFVRMRPGLMFKREAGAEIRRLFFGNIPLHLLGKKPLPFIPKTGDFVLQAVHTSDAAEAVRAALHRDVRGAFNLVAEPVLDAPTLARIARVPALPVPAIALRAGAAASWHLRIQPTSPGWVDLARKVPMLSAQRALDELEWKPAVGADEAFRELLDGIAHDTSFLTPPLSSRSRTRRH